MTPDRRRLLSLLRRSCKRLGIRTEGRIAPSIAHLGMVQHRRLEAQQRRMQGLGGNYDAAWFWLREAHKEYPIPLPDRGRT